jgi:hypothetical protein
VLDYSPVIITSEDVTLPFRYGNIDDKKEVFVFMKKEAKKVVKSQEIKVFARNHPDLMIEMMAAIAE